MLIPVDGTVQQKFGPGHTHLPVVMKNTLGNFESGTNSHAHDDGSYTLRMLQNHNPLFDV